MSLMFYLYKLHHNAIHGQNSSLNSEMYVEKEVRINDLLSPHVNQSHIKSKQDVNLE